MSNLIGLIGKKGSGKDTAAKVLVHDYEYANVKFAAPLKMLVSETFDIPIHQLEDPIFKDEDFKEIWVISNEDYLNFIKNIPFAFNNAGQTDMVRAKLVNRSIKSPRELMQLIGTDICRELDKDFFTKLGANTLDRWINANEPAIVTDVRFQNEINEIKKRKGLIVEIKRDSLNKEDNHASENQDLKADIVIENNGSIEDLYKKMEELHERI